MLNFSLSFICFYLFWVLVSLFIKIRLIRIDPRGGFFKQTELRQAVENKLIETETLEDTKNLHDDEDATSDVIAYKIRVMLHHIRNTHDSCRD